MDFIERLKQEIQEIEGKIDKLFLFLQTDKAVDLSKENEHQFKLLNIQLNIMNAYYEILLMRFADLEN